MRQHYDKRTGEWVDEDEYAFRKAENSQLTARSTLPRPYIATDTMDPVQSMLDGRLYDSKSRLRATYRDAGMIEVGNDPARFRQKPKPKPDRKKIRDSIQKAEARFNRGERVANQ